MKGKIMRYAFWNNKGGTGKTSLAFQSITRLAHDNPDLKILVIDVCPQANLSELLLGSMQGHGSDHLLRIQGGNVRSTVGGYFQMRLPTPYTTPQFEYRDYVVTPNQLYGAIYVARENDLD